MYDGSGYEIQNIYINSTSDNQGLFGYCSSPSIIKNVKLVSGTVIGGRNVGGIVGVRGTGLAIIGCVNKANITGSGNVGGIAGQSQTYCVACENFGEINGSIAAGITGTLSGKMVACVNHGNCIGSYSSGGMVASTISNAAAALTACINEGSISGSSWIGGIAYSLSNYSIDETKELYFANNAGLFVVKSDAQGQGWNTKGPSQISDLNKQETIDSLNAAIAEWNTNNPDYASPYRFAAGGDDNTIPKLVPIE